MANFDLAFELTTIAEGKYVFDKDDKGGETYKGRARNYHPGWEGWKIIDAAKNEKDFPDSLEKNKELQRLLKKSYEDIEWEGIKGSKLGNQAIANEVFDNAAHMGVPRSIEYLQRAINVLNRNQRDYTDINVDRTMGSDTLNALQKCIKMRGVDLLYNVINGYQVMHYIVAMEKNKVNEKYIGWFKRVDINWN